MDIFNVKVWGIDADKFIALSCAKKKEYIKKNTNQKSDVLIDQFIATVKRGTDSEDCQGCKDEQNKRKAVSTTPPATTSTANVAEDSGKGNSAVSGRSNRSKGK